MMAGQDDTGESANTSGFKVRSLLNCIYEWKHGGSILHGGLCFKVHGVMVLEYLE